MNIAEWILVAILSVALLVLIILTICLVAKLIKIAKGAEKIVEKGQNIVEKTEDAVERVKNMTSVSSIVKTFTNKYLSQKIKDLEEEKNHEQE